MSKSDRRRRRRRRRQVYRLSIVDADVRWTPQGGRHGMAWQEDNQAQESRASQINFRPLMTVIFSDYTLNTY